MDKIWGRQDKTWYTHTFNEHTFIVTVNIVVHLVLVKQHKKPHVIRLAISETGRF